MTNVEVNTPVNRNDVMSCARYYNLKHKANWLVIENGN